MSTVIVIVVVLSLYLLPPMHTIVDPSTLQHLCDDLCIHKHCVKLSSPPIPKIMTLQLSLRFLEGYGLAFVLD